MQSTAQERQAPSAPVSPASRAFAPVAYLDPWRGGSAFPRPLQAVKREYGYAGLSRTWRFLPSDSFITPSGVRFAGVSIIFSSDTATSLTRSPPPLIWRRA